MAWARLDDGFHDHPKLIGLPLEAVGLWTLSLTWAHRHHGVSSGLFGHIPADLPQRLGGNRGRKLAALLELHKLWDVEQGLGGWVIHDYVDYLPASEKPTTASQVRKARSDAGKAGARARWGEGKPDGEEWQDDSNLPDQSHSSANGKSMPPNPNPTRPEPDHLTHPDISGNRSIPATIKSKRPTRIPDAFTPTDEQRAWATAGGVGNVEAETAQWMDHHRAKGTTAVDWSASWRTWMRNSVKFASNGRPPPGTGLATTMRPTQPGSQAVMDGLALAERVRANGE
jgi:hypothetical protein